LTTKHLGFLSSIVWGSSKGEMTSLFPGWEFLPPHPTQNAIGFHGFLFDEPVAAVCYFRKAWLSDKLSRINITWWMDRPPDPVIERTYKTVLQALELDLGRPPEIMDVSAPAPAEFRQSALVYWSDSERVITLSCGLVRDGVPSENPALGLGILDPRHDPTARVFV